MCVCNLVLQLKPLFQLVATFLIFISIIYLIFMCMYVLFSGVADPREWFGDLHVGTSGGAGGSF